MANKKQYHNTLRTLGINDIDNNAKAEEIHGKFYEAISAVFMSHDLPEGAAMIRTAEIEDMIVAYKDRSALLQFLRNDAEKLIKAQTDKDVAPPTPTPEAKAEDETEDRITDDMVKKFGSLPNRDCFGNYDASDKACEGSNKSCLVSTKECFDACQAYVAQVIADRQKITASKGSNGGTKRRKSENDPLCDWIITQILSGQISPKFLKENGARLYPTILVGTVNSLVGKILYVGKAVLNSNSNTVYRKIYDEIKATGKTTHPQPNMVNAVRRFAKYFETEEESKAA